MSFEITHIRLTDSNKNSTEKISKVKLLSGSVETKAQVVKYIDELNMDYYYTTSENSRADVETVHPSGGRDPYIRTKGNFTTADNLLSLPEF